jgi:hypothetical protein
MVKYLELLSRAGRHYWGRLLAVSLGFVIIYYTGLLLLTMVRFGEIPNYVVFHDVFHVYTLIFQGTPSLLDTFPIILDEPWFETGFKNPEYYGIASWSFMLIPPKMLLVFLMGLLLGIFTTLVSYGKNRPCRLKADKRLYAAAGTSSALISLTSATLTWVVCCATPSWVVALSMLGMSSSLALWLQPFGTYLTLIGLGLMLWIIIYQLRVLLRSDAALANSA